MMCEFSDTLHLAGQRLGFVVGVVTLVFKRQASCASEDLSRLRLVILFSLVAVAFFLPNAELGAEEPPKANQFVICYNPQTPVQQFARFPLVVVDYEYPPASIASLRQQGKLVFGYLSIAKVHHLRRYVARMKRLAIGLTQDRQFSGTFHIKAANPMWQKLVVQEIVPEMKRLGFNGLFLDDLDDLKNRKLEHHGVSLIREIRRVHPEIKLMANRGLEYLADFAPHVDYVLLESCFLLNGQIRKSADPAWAIGLFNAGKGINPDLRGVAIDYIPKANSSSVGDQRLSETQLRLVARIRQLHSENGLLSCVSTADLQSVPRF